MYKSQTHELTIDDSRTPEQIKDLIAFNLPYIQKLTVTQAAPATIKIEFKGNKYKARNIKEAIQN